MSDTTPTSAVAALEAAGAGLSESRYALNTPEDLGKAVMGYVLAEATAKGTLNATGDVIEVPLTAQVHLPQQGPALDDTVGGAKFCVTSFGYEILCVKFELYS